MKDKIATLYSRTDGPVVRYAAVFFMLLSFPIYALMIWVPFTPLTAQNKILLTAGLFVASEIAFWGGALLLGKEVVDRYRRFFSPSYWLSLLKEYQGW
ncbi:MAG: transporter suffix domain-containing protein [Ardenticatenaceae bacterium]|nr:transporter suffix domain-containing protein [Ardenticatenaceae bacterium]